MTSKLVKCTNCNIVVCEVLAFIQNKLDVMNEEDLVRICNSSFSTEDIETAKNLLFDSIGSVKRKILRKKDGKSKRNLSDVIAVFKELDPDCVPIFVAKDLHKLPPITFDHIDATRLLKDILVLQREVQTIKNSYVTSDLMNELRKDLTNLQQTSVVNNFQIDNINRKRGGGFTDSYCLNSGPMGLPHFLAESADVQNKNTSSINRSMENCPSLSQSRHSPTGVSVTLSQSPAKTGCNETQTQASEEPVGRPTEIMSSASRWSKFRAEAAGNIKSGLSESRTLENNEDGWTDVRKKKRNNKFLVTKGKADSSGNFTASDTKIPLFINHVNKQTTDSDIIEYIQEKTQCIVTLKKINMKRERSYNAYKIFVPQPKLSLFLNEDLWPMGVSFRRFVYIKKDERKELIRNENDNKNYG